MGRVGRPSPASSGPPEDRNIESSTIVLVGRTPRQGSGHIRVKEPAMPAVSVDNILVLPRVPQVPATATDRKVVSVTTAPSGFEGEGFPVRRAFAGVDMRDLDPFIHMDQMGEVEYAPGEPKGTAWH